MLLFTLIFLLLEKITYVVLELTSALRSIIFCDTPKLFDIAVRCKQVSPSGVGFLAQSSLVVLTNIMKSQATSK